MSTSRKTFEPLTDETALEFIERAERAGLGDEQINDVLMSHFHVSEDDIKSLALRSEVFWEDFFLEHTKGIFERKGSRFAAIKFIEKKNGVAGQRRLSKQEIDDLVDSVGNWER